MAFRHFEVKIAQSILSRPQHLRPLPREHYVFVIAESDIGYIAGLALPLARPKCVRQICQYKRVLALLMLEKIKDALFFHQPGQEIKIGLPVLHAVVPLAICSLQGTSKVLAFKLLKYRLNDLRDHLVLENPAISGEGQQPKPGHHLRLVSVESLVPIPFTEATDDAVKEAFI